MGKFKLNGTFYPLCGSTILNPTTVLTSTHCILDFLKNDTNLYVAAGLDHNFLNQIKSADNHIMIEKIVPHPKYNVDLSIAILNGSFEFNENTGIKPGCLIDFEKRDFVGERLIACGPGITHTLTQKEMKNHEYQNNTELFMTILYGKKQTNKGHLIYVSNEESSTCLG